MMQIITDILEVALVTLYEKGVINWLPGEEDAPETFEASCEIEYLGPAAIVILCGWVLFLPTSREMNGTSRRRSGKPTIP